MMDDLVYNYDTGNKLTKVEDIASLEGFKNGTNIAIEYTYDANGNMLSDANKGITNIVYNHLNLPTQVTIAGQNISYIYDAVGTKLRKTVNSITTDYAGNYIYENGQLKFFSHKEGYVEYDGNENFSYVYSYKDHLGSVRLSYNDLDGNGIISPGSEILKEQNTYPFGMPHKGYNGQVNSAENNYKTYLDQEINRELGLDWLTFRFRNYDPSTGRFFGVDPISEKFMDISTYQFAHNTPIWKIELEGLEGIKSQEFNPDGTFKNHVVEKNVIVLTEKPNELAIKSKWSSKKIERKTSQNERKNDRIASRNAKRINAVSNSLDSAFKDAKNSSGERVVFKFNVTEHQIDKDNFEQGIRGTLELAESNGLTSSDGRIAKAAVVGTNNSKSETAGTTAGDFFIQLSNMSAVDHEVGHTLLTRLVGVVGIQGDHSTMGLMHPKSSEKSRLTAEEVDKILEDAYDK